MKLILALFAFLAASCVLSRVPTAAPLPRNASSFVIDADRGGLAGIWLGPGGSFSLSMMSADNRGALTFAARRGCIIGAGVLRPIAPGRYRVERYSGHRSEDCGPYRFASAIAPFDGTEVGTVRDGLDLRVEGKGARRVLRRDRLADLTVRPEHLFGTWRLSAGGRPVTGRGATRLEFGAGRFAFISACRRTESNGFATLPGLLIKPGGDQQMVMRGDCDIRTSGDLLVESFDRLAFTYRATDDHIEARLGARAYEFVRA